MKKKQVSCESGYTYNLRTPKRKVNKEIISVYQGISTSQSYTQLINISFPCTLVGLRWNLVFKGSDASNPSVMSFAIVKVPDTTVASTLSLSDGTNYYRPEQNCLTFGYIAANGPVNTDNFGYASGSIKTKRKMQVGDDLNIICKSATFNGVLWGTVQFFLLI